jgi:hypothetical protein
MNERIIDRLRKLLRHEQSAREIGNMAEAEAFAAKIQEQLDSYNLSLSDIDIEEARSSVAGETTDFKVSLVWQRQLLRTIADINGCAIVLVPPFVHIVGAANDRVIVSEFYCYFERLGIDLAFASLAEYKASGVYKRKRKKTRATVNYKGSFLLGYALALSDRLRKQHAENLAAAEQSTALIYIGNKLADAEMFVSRTMTIRQHKTPSQKKKFRDPAFFAGLEAGESVALTAKTLR